MTDTEKITTKRRPPAERRARLNNLVRLAAGLLASGHYSYNRDEREELCPVDLIRDGDGIPSVLKDAGDILVCAEEKAARESRPETR